MKRWSLAWILAGVTVLTACATSPLGRQQIKFFPEDQMAEMGATAFQQVSRELPATEDEQVQEYVNCVAHAITREVGEAGEGGWAVKVFSEPSANAFALPGGRIGVYTGLLEVARTPDQLATVIAHEVAHVVAEHPNERVSTTYATQAGLDVVGSLLGGDTESRRQVMGLLGMGTQLGVLLPFNRQQETEADLLGLQMMARAGFDPRAAVQLWENMGEAAGNGAPEFLSTHPSHASRIDDLQAEMNQALQLYQTAREQGRIPNCPAPPAP